MDYKLLAGTIRKSDLGTVDKRKLANGLAGIFLADKRFKPTLFLSECGVRVG